MNRHGLTILTTAWVLMAAMACSKGKTSSGAGGGSSAGSSGSNDSSSSEAGSSGGEGGAGGSTGGSQDGGLPAFDGGPADGRRLDGPASAGNTARDAGGTGGSGGKGGSPSTTGGKLDAGPLGPCHVAITPIDQNSLTDLIPGDGSTLKVKGKIEWGTETESTPNWQWTVTGPDGTMLKTTPEFNAEAWSTSIAFPLLSAGMYIISVAVTPTCHDAVIARANGEWPQQYFVRVLPPPSPDGSGGQRCTSGSGRWCPSQDAIPFESAFQLSELTERPVVLGLPKGTAVAIDPAWAPDPERFPAVAIPSTIHIAPSNYRLSAYYSTWIIDGASTNQTHLLAILSPALQYDVLVVPSPPPRKGADQLIFPPFRIGKLETKKMVPELFHVSRGVTVRGTVRMAGVPVTGARILLRAAAADQVALSLPSTWGLSDAMGLYSLSARNDGVSPFSFIAIPPDGTSLPQVTVPGCIDLRNVEDESTVSDVDFDWNTAGLINLTVTVKTADGLLPAPLVRVRLQMQQMEASDQRPRPQLGTLSINGDVVNLPPSGDLRLEATSNTAGVVTFAGIPRAPYHMVLLPPDSLPDAAITTTDLDLTESSSDEQRGFQLARKVKLTGTISPPESVAGGRLVAVDTGSDVLGSTLASSIDGAGNYTLMAAPGRTFRFSFEPAPDRQLPSRIPLYGVAAPAQDAELAKRKLPTGLKASGTVEFFDTGVSKGVAGALVQVFCQQHGLSACMDPENFSAPLPLPVVETTTQADGSYTFYLPDPSSAY